MCSSNFRIKVRVHHGLAGEVTGCETEEGFWCSSFSEQANVYVAVKMKLLSGSVSLN